MKSVQGVLVRGAKGGGKKQKAPVESPDSLRSTNIAKMLIAVGEGEFDEIPTAKDIHFDNTPLQDENGTYNFPNVKWEWRSGSVDQPYIQGNGETDNYVSVGVPLRYNTPWNVSISNTLISSIRLQFQWPQLFSQDDQGNIGGYTVKYSIYVSTDGGPYALVNSGAASGKTRNGYQRSIRIDLPQATAGWSIRVVRDTPNSTSSKIGDTMNVVSYTNIIDQKLRYPNTALLYVEFDAEQFTQFPQITVRCRARRWPVPTNYDPISRTYAGIWDGSFKQAWTNNPAFVTYGICVEDRFGIGKRIKPWMFDKWEMYRIAQYCDELVSDGLGGMEPRYLCDMNLQSATNAWRLLRDISAIYMGMTYWAKGSIYMQADMPRPQDFDYIFTRSNVIDGKFVYSSAERSTHYSRALVSYDNPQNNYDTDVIPVADDRLMFRYGDRVVKISAIGCTRASEAQRRGKWALLSNEFDETVTFSTGIEGRIPLPGHIIPIADERRSGVPNGGRISAATKSTVTLDRDTEIKPGDRLMVNLPNGSAEGRTVKSVSGRTVTLNTGYSFAPEPQMQWAIDSDDLAVQLFRVLKTERMSDGTYQIIALEYNPGKFANIDSGAALDRPPISKIPATTVAPPASVEISSFNGIDQGVAVETMTISWPAVSGAVDYDIEWRRDSGNWVKLPRQGETSVDVRGILKGGYIARVRAMNNFDVSSSWTISELTQLMGKTDPPPELAFIKTEEEVFGIRVSWGFPDGAQDAAYTRLEIAADSSGLNASSLGDHAYPTDSYLNSNMAARKTAYFRGQLVDRSGNVGDWSDWVYGISAGADKVLESLDGQITESQLGKELLGRVDLIDGVGPGSVDARLSEAQRQTQARLDAINADLATITGAPAWSGDDDYKEGQLVKDGSSLYRALQDVPAGTPLSDSDYWDNIGDFDSISGLVSALSVRVDNVETSVDTLENTSSTQAGQISSLQSGLSGTAEDAKNAQKAAQDASNLAGGKGKVLFQPKAPVEDDQQSQNLWIDTSAGQNTPKRWNGTEWVSVTDKAATDAAQAAQDALQQLETKADASVVDALDSRVTQHGKDIESQASAITSLTASIDGVGATGVNLIPAAYSAPPTKDLPPLESNGLNVKLIKIIPPQSAELYAFNIYNDIGAIGTKTVDLVERNGNGEKISYFKAQAGHYVVSFFAESISGGSFYLDIIGVKAKSNRFNFDLTAGKSRARLSFAIDITSESEGYLSFGLMVQANTDIVTLQIDSLMLEGSVSGNNIPSEFSPGSATRELSSLSSATTSLDARVTQNDGDIKSTAESLTSLRASIGGNGNNLLGSEYSWLPKELPTVGQYLVRVSSIADKASDSGYSYSVQCNNESSESFFILCPAVNADSYNIRLQPGNYIVSFYIRGTVPGRVYVNLHDGVPNVATATYTAERKRVSVLINIKSDTKAGLVIGPNIQKYPNQRVIIDSPMVERQIGGGTSPSPFVAGGAARESDALAVANQELSATVQEQGNSIVAQAQRVDTLQASVRNLAGVNLLESQYSWVDSLAAPKLAQGGGITQEGIAIPAAASKFGYHVSYSGGGQFAQVRFAPGLSPTDNNISLAPGDYILSMYIRGDKPGVGLLNLYDGQVSRTGSFSYGTQRSRVSVVVNVPAATKSVLILYPNYTVDGKGANVVFDSPMVERKIGNVTTPSDFVGGQGVSIPPDLIATVSDTSKVVATLDGKIAATRNIKVAVDNNGRQYAAGMGLGVEQTPTGLQSQVLFLADLFAVMAKAGANPQSIFAVTNGQVFMNSAVINQADIINLIISGELKSSNYVAGKTGIRINFVTGEFEINGSEAGKGRMNITNTLLTIYDETRLRLRMGLPG